MPGNKDRVATYALPTRRLYLASAGNRRHRNVDRPEETLLNGLFPGQR